MVQFECPWHQNPCLIQFWSWRNSLFPLCAGQNGLKGHLMIQLECARHTGSHSAFYLTTCSMAHAHLFAGITDTDIRDSVLTQLYWIYWLSGTRNRVQDQDKMACTFDMYYVDWKNREGWASSVWIERFWVLECGFTYTRKGTRLIWFQSTLQHLRLHSTWCRLAQYQTSVSVSIF